MDTTLDRNRIHLGVYRNYHGLLTMLDELAKPPPKDFRVGLVRAFLFNCRTLLDSATI